MGLDTVELVLEVEKKFGINLPDKECEKATTVQDLQNLVWKYIQHRPNAHCRSQQMYYRLRKLIKSYYGIEKQNLNTSLNPNDLFPKLNRRERYYHFSETSGLKMPVLQLSEKLNLILLTIGLILIVGGLIVAFILNIFYHYSSWLYTIPVFGAILTSIFSDILNPYRTLIPQNNMRDFTFKVLSLNYPEVEKQIACNRTDVNEVVRIIIADKAGVELDEVVPHAKFTDDLGMD